MDRDVGSYDFETKDKDGMYADSTGNLTSLSGQGFSDAPGYFGAGARLSGSSSSMFTDQLTRLNWINGSFTVAFWVRPETDYVDGANWRWSFGRQSLWRLGFYGPPKGCASTSGTRVGGSTRPRRCTPYTRGGGTTSPRRCPPGVAGPA